MDKDHDGLPEQEIKIKKRRTHLVIAAMGLSGLALLGILGFLILYPQEKLPSDNTGQTIEDSAFNPFSAITLTAKAAYVIDVHTNRVLYAKNAETQLPLASITKLMTAILAAEILPTEGAVVVQRKDLEPEGDTGLIENQRWRVKDLLDFTLLVSSNDGAQVLAHAAGAVNTAPLTDPNEHFTELMNKKAESIGLPQTYFLNPTGLDTSEKISGGYGSAHDVAELLRYALKNVPDVLEGTREESALYYALDNRVYEGKNTNEITSNIPGFIAGKTGFTDLAGGNLVIAFDAGISHPIIITVLGSSSENRFLDVEKLVQASFDSIAGTTTPSINITDRK